MGDTQTEIELLRAELAELRKEVGLLRDRNAQAVTPTHVRTADIEVVDESASNRRGFLRLAGAAAAAGAAAVVVSNAQPAAAANGGNFILGQSNNATDPTLLVGTFQVLADSSTDYALTPPAPKPSFGGTVYGWNTNTTTDANIRAGVLGVSSPFLFTGTNQSAHGVVGAAAGDGVRGSGVYGYSNSLVNSSAGGRFRSAAGPTIQLEPVLAGVPTSGTWATGAIVADTAGNLWFCVAGGTPGTWRNISLPTFHPITPVRVYDSRAALPQTGVLPAGGTRTISVADARDINTGAVTTAGVVPAGATAITCNVTIDKTVGAGYLAVNPGGNTTVTASTINWSANGQSLANGVTVTLNNNRELTIIAGGGGQTEFIIDVTGYYV